MLNVTPDSVTGWELNRNQPTSKFAKAVIKFLGYFPFTGEDHSLGKQLYHARLITGKTQKQVAEEIGCDPSSLRYVELDRRHPQSFVKQQIQAFIQRALETLDSVQI